MNVKQIRELKFSRCSPPRHSKKQRRNYFLASAVAAKTVPQARDPNFLQNRTKCIGYALSSRLLRVPTTIPIVTDRARESRICSALLDPTLAKRRGR